MKRSFQFIVIIALPFLFLGCKKSGDTGTGAEDSPVLLRLEVAHASGDTSYSRIYLVP